MRATEFIIDNVEEKLKNVPTKPRNFVAKNAMKTTSGAGAHRDKKKEQKQGDFKHKNQGVAEAGGLSNPVVWSKKERDMQRQQGLTPSGPQRLFSELADMLHISGPQLLALAKSIPGFPPVRNKGTASQGSKGYYDLATFKRWVKDNKVQEKIAARLGVAEVTGDQPFDSMMKKVTKTPTAKERNAERIRQKGERQADSRKRSADVFGTSPADKLNIRKAPGVEEGSKEDDPFDQGWRTFFRRGDETDNPYARGTPEYAQWLNGFQEGKAQPRHYESVAVAEKAPPGEKAERMVKHIKKGYAKDGGLSDKERSIAYATAWKHHNK